jgi:thioredoxin 1
MLEPTREEVDALPGPTIVELGASWCGHCQLARPFIHELLAEYPHVRHIRIEDGRGKRLGRSFGVKLWPTFIFMLDGSEVARVVRPQSERELRQAIAKIATTHEYERIVG